MEQSLGQESVPGFGLLDKSRVLDVRPLRRLVPLFPSTSNNTSFSTPQGAAPFVCVSPAGPFPNNSYNMNSYIPVKIRISTKDGRYQV
ncbi:hypothetical protein ACFX13_043414 [Malus domestica]